MAPKRTTEQRNIGKITPRKRSRNADISIANIIQDGVRRPATKIRSKKYKLHFGKAARPTCIPKSKQTISRLNAKQNTKNKGPDARCRISTNRPKSYCAESDDSRDGGQAPEKRRRTVEYEDERLLVSKGEIAAFLEIGENRDVRAFLAEDQCFTISDKYLLAMVFAYMKRAQLVIDEYSEINFFLALYLANEIEEDEDDYKFEILPWALDEEWRELFPDFQLAKEQLWTKMDHRAMVSRSCCEEIISLAPHHWFWRRERKEHHGGAYRNYNGDIRFPRGPNMSPEPPCALCFGVDVDEFSVPLTLSEELYWEQRPEQTDDCLVPHVLDTLTRHRCPLSPPSATVPTCETFELSKDSGISFEDRSSEDDAINIEILSSNDSPITRTATFNMDGLRNSLDDKDTIWIGGP